MVSCVVSSVALANQMAVAATAPAAGPLCNAIERLHNDNIYSVTNLANNTHKPCYLHSSWYHSFKRWNNPHLQRPKNIFVLFVGVIKSLLAISGPGLCHFWVKSRQKVKIPSICAHLKSWLSFHIDLISIILINTYLGMEIEDCRQRKLVSWLFASHKIKMLLIKTKS